MTHCSCSNRAMSALMPLPQFRRLEIGGSAADSGWLPASAPLPDVPPLACWSGRYTHGGHRTGSQYRQSPLPPLPLPHVDQQLNGMHMEQRDDADAGLLSPASIACVKFSDSLERSTFV